MALLDEVCHGDPDLRRELDSLLAASGDQATDPATPPADSLAGRTVGAYQVQTLIDAGGMGQVFRARDTRLNRDVALKLLPAAFALDADRIARFEREAQTLAALNHPNIAQIYGVEETAGGLALVLELVDGVTLSDRIARGPLPLAEALAIARQIADALVAAHDRNIIHRDLKPANVIVRADGTVKVLDFGLAKALATGEAAPAQTLTARGVILGTVAYMPPEQIRGKDGDTRVDTWAFGITVYEMLTGRTPFAGESLADTVGAVLHKEPEWKDIPSGVQPLVRRCLEKDPNRRLRHVADARLWLDAPPPAARTWTQPSAWIAGAALLGVAAVAASGGSIGAFLRRPRPQPAAYPVRFEISPPANLTFAGYYAVSPNGRYVAFRADEPDSRPSVWIHSLESGESHRLTRTGDLSLSSVAWSANSRSVMLVGADGGLKRIGINGEPAQAITALPLGWGGGAWNADDVIVVGQRNGGLIRVSADGGATQPLTELDASRHELGHGGPRFLPDGHHFIYSRASAVPANSALYVGSIDLAPRDQSSTPLLVTRSRPAFAPSSDSRYGYLLVVRDSVLLAYPFDVRKLALAGQPIRVVDDVGVIPTSTIEIASASASTTGVLAYRRAETIRGVPAWLDRDGHALGNFGNDALDAPAEVRISPDGRRVAMVIGGNLWVYQTDGRPATKLTFDGRASVVIWSADGRELLYRDDSADELRTVPSDRIAAPRTASPRGNFLPQAWTANGDVIAAMMLGTGTPATAITDVDIVRFAATPTSVVQPIVHTPAREGDGGLALSPDGRWLAYTSSATGRDEIWVQPLSGSGAPVRVSANGGVAPKWAAGGRSLHYIESGRLMSVTVRGGGDIQFGASTVLFDNRSGPVSYDVGPDGRILLIPWGPFSGRSPIQIVLNWTALLPATAPR